jgi:hypothetical protein
MSKQDYPNHTQNQLNTALPRVATAREIPLLLNKSLSTMETLTPDLIAE